MEANERPFVRGGEATDQERRQAPDGWVWVCSACGKVSRDIYGTQWLTRGWDESCMLNAVMARRGSLVMKNGRVVELRP